MSHDDFKRGSDVASYVLNSYNLAERTVLSMFADGIFESVYVKIENINSFRQ